MNNLLTQQFKEHNITVYGTHEKPLFKAKDIGDLLGISKINKTISNIDPEHKILKASPTGGGLQEQWFLTILGLYEVLFITKKPLAKEFRKWVSSVIEQIRKTGEYRINNKIAIEQKQKLLLAEYSKECSLVYLIKVKTLNEQEYVLKIGETRAGIANRYKEHAKNYPECVLLDCFTVKNSKRLEKFVHDKFRKSRYRELDGHINEHELFLVGKDMTYSKVVDTIKNNLHTYDDYKHITEDKLKLEIEKLKLKNEKLKLKNEQAQTRQSDIDYERIRQVVREELDTNRQQNITNNFNEQLTTVGPRVQQINPENMNIVKIYENVSEVCAHYKIPRSSLNKAYKDNTIYKNFRWNFVSRELDPSDTSGLQPTKMLTKIYNLGYIAKLTSDKTKIINVYLDRKSASHLNNYKSVAYLDSYVKNNKICGDFYYMLYEAVEEETRQRFLEDNELTEVVLYKSGVGQYDTSGKLVKEFRSKHHCKEDLNIGEKSLNKAIMSGRQYSRYCYKMLNEKLKCLQ